MTQTTHRTLNVPEVRKFLSRHMLVDGLEFVLDLEKSHGSRLYEGLRDKEFLDLFGFFGSAALGLNHPKMHQPEVEQDLLMASRSKPSNADFATMALGRFVERLDAHVIPPELPYLFFIDGGGLAVENALKAAFDWKTRLNMAKGIATPGHRILHFQEAFHGRTGYTMSLTNTDPIKIQYFPKFDWPRVHNPKIAWPLDKPENLACTVAGEQTSLREIHEAIERYPHEIAGIILETIQGEGGDSHFRPEFFRELRKIADENDILLIYDEVQCGFGTTGKWWAWQHHGIAPDLLAFGKKAQTCGVLASRRLDQVEKHVFAMSSRINSTWGGNLVDMVRSMHTIDTIVEENLLDNITRMGALAISRLTDMQKLYPDKISQTRGLGGMIAFDLPTAEMRNRLRKDAFENHLLILACGAKSIRFRPALSITPEEMNQALDILEACIKAL